MFAGIGGGWGQAIKALANQDQCNIHGIWVAIHGIWVAKFTTLAAGRNSTWQQQDLAQVGGRHSTWQELDLAQVGGRHVTWLMLVAGTVLGSSWWQAQYLGGT